MFLLDEIFSSELRSRVALADVFLKLECLVQSKDDLHARSCDSAKKKASPQVKSEQQRRKRRTWP